MNKIFRVIAAGLLAVVVVIVVFGAVLILYNLEDDRLEPEVARMLEERPQQIPAEENSYFAWIGVVGPEDVPPHEWGRRWYEEALTADRERRLSPLAIDSEERSGSFRDYETPCDKADKCLEAVAEHPADAQQLLARAEAVLARCDAVNDFPEYQVPWRPNLGLSFAFPPFQMSCGRLQRTRFALAVALDRDDEALAYLEKEVAFHIRLMQGAYTMLDKIIAITYLQHDYLLLNQYMRRRPDASMRRARLIAKMLQPFDVNEGSMSNVAKAEFMLGARHLLELPTLALSLGDTEGETRPHSDTFIEKAVLTPLYLSNATVNSYYRWYKQYIRLDRLSDESYRNSLENIKSYRELNGDDVIFGITLRNPVGSILLNMAQIDITNYFLIRDNLFALRASVAFQLDLLSRGIADDEVISQTSAAAELVHRFSGKAAIWDKAKRALVYSGAQDGREDLLVVTLF